MSLDWGAVGSAVTVGGLALVLVGMVVNAIVGASLRKRPRLTAVGSTLMGVGALTPFIVGDDPTSTAGQILVATVLILYFFVQTPLTRGLAVVGSLAAVGLHLRSEWLEGKLSAALWQVAIVSCALVAIFAFVWLREKLQSLKPRRDAHA